MIYVWTEFYGLQKFEGSEVNARVKAGSYINLNFDAIYFFLDDNWLDLAEADQEESQTLQERIDAWYDQQTFDTLFLISVSPLLLIAAILIIAALVLGR